VVLFVLVRDVNSWIVYLSSNGRSTNPHESTRTSPNANRIVFSEPVRMNSSTLTRVFAVGAILAGVLRAITSFIPETTPNVFLVYLVIDLCLLSGVIGLYRFTVTAARLVPRLGTALMCLALLVLIARDVGVAPVSLYAGAAMTFSVGIDLFAIHLLQTRKMPSWIPIAWLVSTVIGPLGFFVPQLHFLLAMAGLIFGVAFAVAGVVMWLRDLRAIQT